jgi:tetratricopeptide (TPR) repeat protein
MHKQGCKERHRQWKWMLWYPMVLVLALIAASQAASAGGADDTARYHNRKGIDHFEAAFYEHTPKGQGEEASREYALAEAEFKNAIKEEPGLVEPHRNLARLSFIRKKFADAAEQYETVTKLDPYDLDAYVNLALAQIELKNYGSAIDALREAKTRTTDEKARDTLNGYIEKIQRLQ